MGEREWVVNSLILLDIVGIFLILAFLYEGSLLKAFVTAGLIIFNCIISIEKNWFRDGKEVK